MDIIFNPVTGLHSEAHKDTPQKPTYHLVKPVEMVFATGNLHKLSEAQEILGPSFHLKTPADLGFHGDIPETGSTIKENAIQKAMFVFEHFGITCFADDTGLEIDALDGAPGVYSARYAGPDKDPKDNIRKVLAQLAGVPPEKRTARFRCVIALATPGQDPVFSATVPTGDPSGAHSGTQESPLASTPALFYCFEGVCEGHIINEEEGSEGFGYDPIFVPEGYDKTFAELTADEKNAISHRGIALRAFADFLH